MLTLPLRDLFRDLENVDRYATAEVGVREAPEWIPGTDLLAPARPPFSDLLRRIGTRMGLADRRSVAASFLLRFGWSSGPAIALYLAKGVVPRLRLEQTSYRFSESTLFERIALRDARIHGAADGPRRLRETLVGQTGPVIEALHDWSRMTRPGLWGQVTSSWGAQFLIMAARLRGQAAGVSEAEQFFAGDDFVSLTQPRFYAITQEGRTKYFHVRGACCRYYLAPTGSLCASCPILDRRTRRERNVDWMNRYE